jgi:hypothetical protein
MTIAIIDEVRAEIKPLIANALRALEHLPLRSQRLQ